MDKRQAGAGARGGAGWGLPTPQELLVGAHCPDADLLVDDIHAAEAEGMGREGSARGEDPTPTPGWGLTSGSLPVPTPRGWLELPPPHL